MSWNSDCRPIANDLSLDQATRDVFTAWAAEGYAQGDPSTYLSGAVTASERPPFDLEAYPLEAFELAFDELDEFRCMGTDLVLEEDTWVIGSDWIPDNAEVVHHLSWYAISPEAAEDLAEMDARSARPGIDCYGEDSDFWRLGLDEVWFWLPGFPTWLEDESDGTPVGGKFFPAGTHFVLEGHFNSIASGGGSATDTTGFGLWTLPSGQTPDEQYRWASLFDVRFTIPAGDGDYQVFGNGRVTRPSEVIAVLPHMHLLGTKLESTLTQADGSEKCLAQVDSYNFDWQWLYWLPAEDRIPVDRNTAFEVVCHYDNSAENQPVIDGEQGEPVDVGYGDGSTDELCFNYLLLSSPIDE